MSLFFPWWPTVELNNYTKRYSISEENQMLHLTAYHQSSAVAEMRHLTAYHQSSAVADNRKAPAGNLQFKNERVALSPRLLTTLSSFHFTSVWYGFCTAGFVFWFSFIFSLSSQLSPVFQPLSTSSPTSLPRSHALKPVHSSCCCPQHLSGFHGGISPSVWFGNRGSHTKTKFARLQRADNGVQEH